MLTLTQTHTKMFKNFAKETVILLQRLLWIPVAAEAINLAISVGAQYNLNQDPAATTTPSTSPDAAATTATPAGTTAGGSANGATAATPQVIDKPISTTMQCVLWMTLLYLLVYLGVHTGKAVNQLFSPGEAGGLAGVESVFRKMAAKVQMAPMLAILFVGIRLRAIQLDPIGGSPPASTQFFMVLTTIGVAVDVLVTGLAEYGLVPTKEELEEQHRRGPNNFQNDKNSSLNKWMTMLSKVVLIGIYIGFTATMIAFFTMEAPTGNENCPQCKWRATPALPPALICLISLTIQYFGVFLAIQVIETMSWYKGGRNPDYATLVKILEDSKPSLQMCPLVAVIFIAARLRAEQCQTDPQGYAQFLMLVVTYCLFGQTLVSIATPYMGQGKSQSWRNSMRLLEYVLLGGVYIGTVFVVFSLSDLKPPKAAKMPTPPVAPPVVGATDLIYLYFGVYLFLQVARTIADVVLQAKPDEKSNLQILIESVLPSLDMTPMISVLFVAGRMRSMEIDPKQGQLQEAQFFISITVWMIMAQAVLCAFSCYLSGELESKDKDNELKQALRENEQSQARSSSSLQNQDQKVRDLMLKKLATEAAEKEHRRFYWTKLCTRVKFAAIGLMYIGLGGVCYNILDQVSIANGRTNVTALTQQWWE